MPTSYPSIGKGRSSKKHPWELFFCCFFGCQKGIAIRGWPNQDRSLDHDLKHQKKHHVQKGQLGSFGTSILLFYGLPGHDCYLPKQTYIIYTHIITCTYTHDMKIYVYTWIWVCHVLKCGTLSDHLEKLFILVERPVVIFSGSEFGDRRSVIIWVTDWDLRGWIRVRESSQKKIQQQLIDHYFGTRWILIMLRDPFLSLIFRPNESSQMICPDFCFFKLTTVGKRKKYTHSQVVSTSLSNVKCREAGRGRKWWWKQWVEEPVAFPQSNSYLLSIHGHRSHKVWKGIVQPIGPMSCAGVDCVDTVPVILNIE